jgi:hypothetical protein
MAMSETTAREHVAPSDISVGDEIQCPASKNWFVVCEIHVSLACKTVRTFGRNPWVWDCDVYHLSGALGQLVAAFEGQQSILRRKAS